ncbi:Uncharacterised protein [Mycobacterium tuberculosis]|uniref:Uncharacterized protein n=1 Tax=Mycobacterium tuberculosis TaxID=1773 RepID=A0A0U0UEA5_MYCTX|nr:Uncharacterised protein [Mycobacterium tuberculosis]COW12613.1 Uncharacterised protein [Mycobacterium tuberculosis]COX17077.1 Uncharacterised protein [Mycobacterium tuberculosis]COZ41416.1 Uncharacterised protein [Mycobacterium tuberculosis]COZ94402.1 Uncharacterised protein [Mycobacterium tuberculosis]
MTTGSAAARSSVSAIPVRIGTVSELRLLGRLMRTDNTLSVRVTLRPVTGVNAAIPESGMCSILNEGQLHRVVNDAPQTCPTSSWSNR